MAITRERSIKSDFWRRDSTRLNLLDNVSIPFRDRECERNIMAIFPLFDAEFGRMLPVDANRNEIRGVNLVNTVDMHIN